MTLNQFNEGDEGLLFDTANVEVMKMKKILSLTQQYQEIRKQLKESKRDLRQIQL